MSTITNLDVLVVYSASIAKSATIPDDLSMHPFMQDSKRANYNLSYAYFLEACKDRGLNAGFTSSSDIIGPGTCNSYWTASSSRWHKILRTARSQQIFSKLSTKNPKRKRERQLLFSAPDIQPFNNHDLHQTFFDKLLTYQSLPRYSVPTIGIRSNKPESVLNSLTRLRTLIKQHPFKADFSSAIILKDRFGAGGDHVYKITRNYAQNIARYIQDSPNIKFVIQPFLKFDQGYLFQNTPSTVDIRLIYQYNQVIQSYIRVAQSGEFLCNEHQGGDLIYVPSYTIPSHVHKIGAKLVKKINKPNSLYALDFVISNSGKVYFLEGNIGPGIDWDVTKPKNERKSKELIDYIVSEFATRVRT